MPAIAVNIVLVLLLLGMTYALMSEGLWGSALMFFDILFAGLVAFNFYEPLATLMVDNIGESVAKWADMVCLMLLFLITLVILRVTTDQIAPSAVRFPTPVFHLGRIVFGLAASCLSLAVLLAAFHTAPVHKLILDNIDYDFQPPFNLGLDRKWLAFFQYSTGYTFADYDADKSSSYWRRAEDREFGTARVFDPRGRWLIDHQNARPYGRTTVPEPEEEPAAAPAPEAAAGGAPM